MDALVELLPLLFIGLYYLLAARRRAAKQREAQSRTEAPQTELVGDANQAPSPFQAFLQQLEAAAAEASGVDPEPTPAEPARPSLDEARTVPPSPVPTARLEPAGLKPREFQAPAGSFDSWKPTDHGRHGFGAENPLSEEAFERAPAFASRRPPADRRYDPHGLDRPEPSHELGRDWSRSLRDPKAAREAFVLQTIFGPRGGRRAENR